MQQISLLRLFHLVLFWFIYYSKGDISEYFFNALNINCFIIIEKKVPKQFLQQFLDSSYCWYHFILPKYCQGISRTLVVVAVLLFKRPICDERSALFAVHCPPWDPKKIDKKDGVLLTALNFRKKIVSPDKRKHIAEVSNFSVTSCLVEALKIELTTYSPHPTLWKQRLGKDFKHSIVMTLHHNGFIFTMVN